MNLVRYNPTNGMASIYNHLGSFFNDPFFKPLFSGTEKEMQAWHPMVDIFEDKEQIIIKADLPGVKKENISINVNNRILTLKGERSHEDEAKEENFFRRERSFGSFQRSFTLPADISMDDIKAEFKEGILKIAIPMPEEKKERQIAIN